MNTLFKLDQKLLSKVHADLSRRHEYASERVGFLQCRAAALKNGVMIIAESYYAVADGHYLHSHEVGALINADAIRAALQMALQQPVCIFHIHRHDHNGTPRFSPVDHAGNARLIPDFHKVRPNMPHGAVVLSNDSMAGLCWMPNSPPVAISRFEVIGRNLCTFGATE